MCGTCGCSDGDKAKIINLENGEHVHVDGQGNVLTHTHSHDPGEAHTHDQADDHSHLHSHSCSHSHDHTPDQAFDHHHRDPASSADEVTSVVPLEAAILQKNDQLAGLNRAWFQGREILALNLVSSPGSGKTSLIERTIVDLKDDQVISVIEGDQQTSNDAERIKATGAPSVQINTGTGCHLEADMVGAGLKLLKPKAGSIVIIENVGNLVCPAMFDLGEAAKVAILSVTEGEDKPLKYPHMFQAAELMLLNKIDLLPHVDFDVDASINYAREVNPDIEVIQLSAKSGEGMNEWYDWCAKRQKKLIDQSFTIQGGV